MRRQSGPRRLAAAAAALLVFAPAAAAAVEVHLADDSLLDASSPAPDGHLPVLFVHGHGGNDEASNPNYQNNWQEPLNGLPSFQQALTENEGLGIEEYYIRFLDQDRSITEDAREIGEAIELILQRHDPDYPAEATNVQVAIIAYSKGTISARQYLKSLQAQVADLPAPRPDFRPVSEFIALSPPNHGISTPLFALTQSLAVKQLYNGFRPDGVVFDCSDSFATAAATDYIQDLNGHDIADTISLALNESYADEAPGSRPDGDPPTAGTLYVALFANDNRDFVGGATPSTDCAQPDGRKLALNLAPEAVNIEVPDIAGNTPATVHANTVHTFEVMCLALYAVAHHRSPPLGQTCQPANGVPVIPPPSRAAAMLTLDMSGSMSAPACPGCATRAAVLKDAVELFVQLWSAVSVPSDRIGVTYFRTDVDQFALNGAALPLLSDGADDVITDVGGQMPGNATAMGGGLQRAIEALDDPSVDSEIRRVILFTDGMQNVNPMVLPVGGHHEIINEAGRPSSNVTPTGWRLDQLGGIAVDTIGIGAGQAFVGRLEDIANETGGRTWLTTAPDDDLRRFFVEELINALRGFSPQLVAYRRGSTGSAGGTEAFAIEDGVRKLVLKVSWKRGASLDVSVIKDGVDVTSAGRFIAGAFYRIFVIDLPGKSGGGPIAARGNWQLRIKGKAGTPYEAAAIVDGGPVIYEAMFDVRRPRMGDPLDLVVRLAADGRPIGSGVKVTAIVTRPATAAGDIIAAAPTKDLPAFEPGATAAERQMLAFAQDPKRWAALDSRRQTAVLDPNDKGEFRARFRPQLPGIHTAIVTIEGDDGKIGPFTRTLTATAIVRFANADPKASTLSVSERTQGGGRRYVTLIVSPRDARGTRMGPGLLSEISLRLSAGRTVGGTHDLGDGRYMLVLALAPGDDPSLKLEVAGGTLFAGRLSQLSGKRTR
jgi:hypothetical protein